MTNIGTKIQPLSFGGLSELGLMLRPREYQQYFRNSRANWGIFSNRSHTVNPPYILDVVIEMEIELLRPDGISNHNYRFDMSNHGNAPEALVSTIPGTSGCWPD
jgi:hypothetical protein